MEVQTEKVQLQKYPAYKDSGFDWLGMIPEHWELRRLKNLCDMRVSNVDKHIRPLQESVRLCNYVDVYKNDFITENLMFMESSASDEEIGRFRIKRNDVLITKDSEDWKDIGNPALVKYEATNLVCGYHLAILRPSNQILGGFLLRMIQTPFVQYQFSIKANGITRYGISHGAILDTSLMLPPLPEQTAIAAFLDDKTAKIDQAIAQKQKLIELLKERKQILIQQAVTNGLNPNAKMKDSGVEWIGEIPEGWEVVKNKILFKEIKEPGNEDLPLLTVSIHTAVSSAELDGDENIRGKIRIEDKSSYKYVEVGDIVFNMMRAWQGAIGAVKTKGMVSPAYIVVKPNNKIISEFFEYQYRTTDFIQQMDRFSKGITDFRKRLYWDEFKQLITILPPTEEQLNIIESIETQSAKIDKAIGLQQQQIEKLKEYKATLIDAAVTGKIKVG